MATPRVQKARAQYRLTNTDRYPQLNGEDSGNWNDNLRGDTITAWGFLTNLNTSFDLDFFGCLKNMSETGRQDYPATGEVQRAVHILLVSGVAQSYFDQQLAYAQLQIAGETLHSYQQSYAFVEKQLSTGSNNVPALEQTRGVMESTHSDVAKRQGELARTNSVLQLLLGSYGKLPQAQTIDSDSL